jgi:hypothetical protein
MELGSVTLKRIGFFCFPIKHSTHTLGGLEQWAAMDYGTGITGGGGSGYATILAHAGGVLYGTELGSVTLKRVGSFCFPIKHSTHTEGSRADICGPGEL